MAVLLPVPHPLLNLRGGGHALGIRRDRESPRLQGLVGIVLRSGLETLACANAVANHVEPTLLDVLRVLHAQPTCRRVAGVGKSGLAVLTSRCVDLLELIRAHVHLAADLHQGGNRILIRASELVRNVRDNARIGSNVLSHTTITTRGGRGKLAVAVDQVNGQAINLQLGQISLSRRAVQPVLQLIRTEDVVQAVQALQVLDIYSTFRSSTYLLGRRIRSLQLRVLCLQR